MNTITLITTLSIAIIFFYYYVLTNYTSSKDEGKCEVTYMVNFPQFMRLGLSPDLEKKYKQYSLFSYSEGKLTERTRYMVFTGIPILFIPGHSGSYKQVRSMASLVTHRMYDLQSIFHFDFFTVDLNEEYSALFGGVLQDQTNFIKECINKILNLYSLKNRPRSVILIGHSMGGVIARALFLDKNFDTKLVKLIITLAAPHKPVLLIDGRLAKLYNDLDYFWKTEKQLELQTGHGSLENLTLISIGSGRNDLQVRAGLTYCPYAELNVLTTAIPQFGISVDHHSIIWCRNLMRILSRLLYDSVDIMIKGITLDKELLYNISSYHLIKRSAGKYYTPEIHKDTLLFARTEKWYTLNTIKRKLTKEEINSQSFMVAISLFNRSSDFTDETFAINAEATEKQDWICGCKETSSKSGTHKPCEDNENLSQLGSIDFGMKGRTKYLTVNMSYLKDRMITHVAVRGFPVLRNMGFSWDLYNNTDRVLYRFIEWTMYPIMVLEETSIGALRYKLHLIGMKTVWETYKIHLFPIKCSYNGHKGYVVFKTPWNNEDIYTVVSRTKLDPLIVFIQTLRPFNSTEFPYVDFYLDPECTYSIKVEPAMMEMAGVLAVRFMPAIPGNIAMLLIAAFSTQLTNIIVHARCPSFFDALLSSPWMYLTSRIILMIVTYTSKFIVDEGIPMIFGDTGNDATTIWFPPLIVYSVSLAIVCLFGRFVWLSVRIFGRMLYTLHKWSVWNNFINICDPDWISLCCKLSLTHTTIFMLVSWFVTCGGFALLIGLVAYFYKLCKMYENFLKLNNIPGDPLTNYEDDNEIDNEDKKEDDEEEDKPDTMDESPLMALRNIQFHFTIFMIWTFLTVLYFPSALSWAKNARIFGLTNSYLENDVGIVYSLLSILCFSSVLRTRIVNIKLGSQYGHHVTWGSGIAVLIYGARNVYLLHYLAFAFVIVVGYYYRVSKYYRLYPPYHPHDRFIYYQKALIYWASFLFMWGCMLSNRCHQMWINWLSLFQRA